MAMRPAVRRYRNGAPTYPPCRPRRAMAESPRTITPLSTRPSECRRVACRVGSGDDRCSMTPLKRKKRAPEIFLQLLDQPPLCGPGGMLVKVGRCGVALTPSLISDIWTASDAY